MQENVWTCSVVGRYIYGNIASGSSPMGTWRSLASLWFYFYNMSTPALFHRLKEKEGGGNNPFLSRVFPLGDLWIRRPEFFPRNFILRSFTVLMLHLVIHVNSTHDHLKRSYQVVSLYYNVASRYAGTVITRNFGRVSLFPSHFSH